MAIGKKSRKLKKLSECMSDILSLKVTEENDISFLTELGIAKNSTDNKMLIMARLFEKASKGDISAIKEIRGIMNDSENKDKGLISEIIEAVKNVG